MISPLRERVTDKLGCLSSVPFYSGAGIGGLVCALALSRCPDIEVAVYEAASQFGEVGAGVSVFPRMLSHSSICALDTHSLVRTLEDSQMVGRRQRSTQLRRIETQGGSRLVSSSNSIQRYLSFS